VYYDIYYFIDGSTFFGVKSSFYESPLGGNGSLMISYVTFYCVHAVHSRYDITSMDDVVYMLIPIWKQTLFGNGDSPYGNIRVSLPISVLYGDSPYGNGERIFGHLQVTH
jgi:hypothetical protein